MFGSIKSCFTASNTQLDRWLLAALVFALPFERIPSADVAGVTVRASLIIGGLVILRAAQKLLTRAVAAHFGWTERLLALFGAWLVVLIPLSINKPRALEVTVFTLFVLALAIAVKILWRREFLGLILRALLWSTAIVCLFGLYQYIGNLAGLGSNLTGLRGRYSWQLFGFPRIQSTALEPLYFASFLTLPLAILLALWLQMGWRRSRAALLLLASVDLFLTVSRGGTYSYAIFAVCLLAYSIWRGHARRAGMCLLTILIAYGASLVIIGYLNQPFGGSITHQTGVKSYTKQITNTGLEGSGDERTQARRQAWLVFTSHPLTGVGPGNFGPTIQHNQPSAGGWTIVNNEPLELLAETGVVGFGLLMAALALMAVSAIRAVWPRPPNGDPVGHATVLGLLAFMIGLAVQYQTFSTLYIVHIWVALGLLMGLTGGLVDHQAERQA